MEVAVKLTNSEVVTRSYLNNLIMLHTASTNAQFDPDTTVIGMV